MKKIRFMNLKKWGLNMDYLGIRELYHSVFAEEEKARRKAALKNINRDFFQDLPSQVCSMLDEICWSYKDQPWFEEAWEKYRKHVLDAGLGGKIKMPGFVFNEYIDRYVDELEKKNKKELAHMDACDIEELYHHGIKGQRWGIRRYQNDDGTLTAEGKKRYGANNLSEMSPDALKQYQLDRKSAVSDAKKDLKARKLSAYSDLGKNFVSDKYGNETLKDLEKDQKVIEARVSAGMGIVGVIATVGIGAYLIKDSFK